MTDFLGLNRAVPSASLLDRGDLASLGFETTSWKHLNRYVNAVENLPAAFDSAMGSADALAKLRPVVDGFGSPQQLRTLIKGQANALTADQPPRTLYVSAAWMVAHLHRSACSIVATLQNFSSLSGTPGAVKGALRQLGGDAENARKAIGPIVEALKRFKVAILDANGALAAGYAQDSDTLRQLQEDVGRTTVKIDTLQKQMAQVGFFSSSKKEDLGHALAELHQQKDLLSGRSETLRAALASIEPVQNEGFWLASGVDDLVGFLDKLRQTLTTFGSGITQVAADASDSQLQDAAGMEPILGTAAAIGQWNAIAKASEKFLSQATVDFPALGGAAGGRP